MSLRDDLSHRLAKVDFDALVSGNFELVSVEAQLVQDRGVKVGYVMAMFDGVKADPSVAP